MSTRKRTTPLRERRRGPPPSKKYKDRDEAVTFVQGCEERDIAVLGIEGFVEKDGLVAQLDIIADFSPLSQDVTWDEYRPKVNRIAIAFLEKAPERQNLVFEFETWSRDDWRADGRPLAAKNHR